MRFFLFLTLSLIFFQTNAQNSFDKRSGIRIEFAVNDSTFGQSWLEANIDAKGSDLNKKEIKRSKKIIEEALSKYPIRLLNYNLKKVVILDSLLFYGSSYKATNDFDVIYVTNRGVKNGFTNDYVEKLFHHEFSSILMRNYYQFFEIEKWTEPNRRQYRQENNGQIRTRPNKEDFNDAYAGVGFLHEYAISSLENDFNSFAEYLFINDDSFWEFTEKHPRLKTKLNLTIQFYSKLNKAYTEEYFKAL